MGQRALFDGQISLGSAMVWNGGAQFNISFATIGTNS
jgi:hypothetical protein